jgi:alanyl-tRNA synthetase
VTERLYYHDSYLKEFRARIVDRSCDPCEIYLDRTAFYPSSGGQPHDTGRIQGVAVIDVIDEGSRIRHRTAAPVNAEEVHCAIDWPRRFDHMQQHSGQHLLSAVLATLYGAETVSFHLGREVSTIELAVSALAPEQLREAERRANEIVFENRPVTVSFEDAAAAQGLRRASEREGLLRIVEIEGLDRSACGGTHVRRTGEIGPVLIRRAEKIRGNLRLEFLCGRRAMERARADYEALAQVARLLSCALDEAPALVAAQQARLVEAEKARARLALDLAAARGRELYRQTPPGAAGVRALVRHSRSGVVTDELRAEAQSFTAGPQSVFLATFNDPPAVLLALSEDLGRHAGNLLKEALAEAGGRGGGSARTAQGSLPDAAALAQLEEALSRRIPALSLLRSAGSQAGG